MSNFTLLVALWVFPKTRYRSLLLSSAVAVFLLSNARADDPVYLVYDEQHIKDADRAALVELIAKAIPESQWKSLPLTHGRLTEVFVEQLVSKYYGFYKRDFRATTEALVALISQANRDLPQNAPVRVPPIPVSANAWYHYGATIRTFEPLAQAYLRSRNLWDLRSGSQTDFSPVKTDDARRGANLTAISVPKNAVVQQLISSPRFRVLLKTSVVPTSKNGFAKISLLSTRPDACNAGTLDWLPVSPYRSLWDQIRPAAGTPAFASLKAAAQANPLYVADWDIGLSGGHGSKVLSAAKYVLHSLQLDEVADTGLRPLELDPKQNKVDLISLVNAWKSYGDNAGRDPDVSKIYLNKTLAWINNPPLIDPSDPAGFVIPEFLLQALFWQYFDQQTSWMNLSFSINSVSLDVLSASLLIGTNSYGFLAAGNDPLELDLNTIPQAGASNYPTLANITYGDLNGNIFGAYSSIQYNTHVAAVAPGCGISFDSLTAADYGSSFASPYVAAAAWLRNLTTPTAFSDGPLRFQLVLASRPQPSLARPVDSGGYFDPALLLAAPGPHVIDNSNQVVRLDAVRLSLALTDGSLLQLVRTNTDASRLTRTLVVSSCAGQPCLWYRIVTLNPSPSVSIQKLVNANLTGSLLFNGSNTVSIASASDFSSKYKELWF